MFDINVNQISWPESAWLYALHLQVSTGVPVKVDSGGIFYNEQLINSKILKGLYVLVIPWLFSLLLLFVGKLLNTPDFEMTLIRRMVRSSSLHLLVTLTKHTLGSNQMDVHSQEGLQRHNLPQLEAWLQRGSDHVLFTAGESFLLSF